MPELLIAALLIGSFAVIAGILLLCYALLQVTKMHRALVDAGLRIEHLEQTVSQIALGAPVTGQLEAADAQALPRAAAEAVRPVTPQADAAAPPEPKPEPVEAAAAPPPPRPPEPPRPTPKPTPAQDVAPAEGWPWGAIAVAGAALLALLLGANGVISPVATLVLGLGVGGLLLAAGTTQLAGGRLIAPPLGAALIGATLVVAAGPLAIIPPGPAFLAFSVLCVISAGLSAWSGQTLAAVAALMGAAAPLAFGLGAEGAIGRYGHLIAMTSVMLLLGSVRPTLIGWALVMVGAALTWGVVDAIQGVALVPAYLAALGVLGLCLLWDESAAPGPLSALWTRLQLSREATKVGAALTVAAAALLVMTIWRANPNEGAQAAAGFLVLAAITHAACAVRPGFGGFALILTGIGALAVLAWPQDEGVSLGGLSEAHAVLIGAGMLGLLGLASGWREAQAPGREGNAIAFGSLAPLAIIGAAALRLQGAEALWLALGALVVSASSALMAQGFAAHAAGSPGAGAARTTGMAIAGAAAALAVTTAAPEEWLTVALAGLVPALIWIDKQRGGAALTGAAVLVAAAALVRLLSPWAAAAGPLGDTPLLNMLVPIYGASAMFFFFGAGLLADAPWRSAPLARQCLMAFTWVTGAAFLSMQVRHAFSNGAMTTSANSLAELGLHATIWIGLALALRVSDRREPAQPFALAENFSLIAGAGFGLFGAGLLLNPWWGPYPAPAPTVPLLNDLMAGFFLPAAALGLYAWACARERQPFRARWAGGAAGLLGFLQLILELRRSFAGAAMATAAQGEIERWVYTGAALACAAGLLVLGMERKSVLLRVGSLALVLAALAKAMVFDLTAVEGGMRVLAALCILGVGALTWRFYQTRVFKPAAAPRGVEPGANPAPPQ